MSDTTERLEKAHVSRLEELISLLEAHPEVNRIMELLGGSF